MLTYDVITGTFGMNKKALDPLNLTITMSALALYTIKWKVTPQKQLKEFCIYSNLIL